MFEWLENIWNGIKGFCEFFASILQYIRMGFDMLGSMLRYPVDFVANFGSFLPAWVLPLFITSVLVTAVSLILGRRSN